MSSRSTQAFSHSDFHNYRISQGPGQNKQIYAMKVIRKSDMLRNSQEGHLRAERDFLVAAEGSQWYLINCHNF